MRARDSTEDACGEIEVIGHWLRDGKAELEAGTSV
jgi:hypothetical protein